MSIAGKHPSWQGGSFSLYVHVPFCRRKCPYCHFYVIPYRERDVALLDRALRDEWRLLRPQTEGLQLASLYFGGGTPALVSPALIAGWIEMLRGSQALSADCEITIEANPEDLSPELIEQFVAAGINRLSLGVQSLQDSELRQLGRSHSAEQAILLVEQAVQAGLGNISIDLMFETPGQTLESWSQTLEQASKLPISHLSLYNLTIEPHTAFDRRRKQIEPMLPNEEQGSAMLQLALDRLAAAGMQRYELSAFCRDGKWSRHNTGYWLGRPFLGLGPAAWSFWNRRRFRNIPRLHRYAALVSEGASATDEAEELSSEALQREMLAVQLRLCKGIDLEAFQREWGELDADLQRVLLHLRQIELLEERDGRLLLSTRGQLLHDSVASELVAH
jgi:oxygen-independent coproporphyrinogen-3 oxidase